MGDGSDSLTRRQALKRMGTAALGTALGSQLPPAQKAEAQTSVHVSTRKKSAPGGPPNVLWITAEGTPLSVLSCYGSKLISTPHIDRIAQEGMRFTNSFCTNGLCAPSRATLLTGTYSHVNGMLTNPEAERPGGVKNFFHASQPMLGRLMQKRGYLTGTVGKWHLPIDPGQLGFDYFTYKNGAGGPYYDPHGYLRNPSMGSKEVQHATIPGYITDNVTHLLIDGMQQMHRSDKPFFMMAQFFNDHRPFDPPHKYEHIYDGVRIPEPATFYDDYSHRAAPAREARMRIADMPDFHPPTSLTTRQRQQWNYQKFMEHFLGTLRAQDDAIGELLAYLDRSGLADNTIVIYTSDHGFFMGDHGWFDKRFMYEQPLRVPWMVRYPGVVKEGSLCDAWGLNIDNAPTALDLVGAAVPSIMQGHSLKPLLQGQSPPDWRRSLYYHYYEFGAPHWVAPHYGVRTERYKLIYYDAVNEWELFDLERDPDEMESLMEWSGYKVHPEYEAVLPGLVSELKGLRQQYHDTTGYPVKMWAQDEYD